MLKICDFSDITLKPQFCQLSEKGCKFHHYQWIETNINFNLYFMMIYMYIHVYYNTNPINLTAVA